MCVQVGAVAVSQLASWGGGAALRARSRPAVWAGRGFVVPLRVLFAFMMLYTFFICHIPLLCTCWLYFPGVLTRCCQLMSDRLFHAWPTCRGQHVARSLPVAIQTHLYDLTLAPPAPALLVAQGVESRVILWLWLGFHAAQLASRCRLMPRSPPAALRFACLDPFGTLPRCHRGLGDPVKLLGRVYPRCPPVYGKPLLRLQAEACRAPVCGNPQHGWCHGDQG